MTEFCRTSIHILASRDAVWSTLTRARNYPIWNEAITCIDGVIEPGARIRLYPAGTWARALDFQVEAFSPPEAMVWKGGMPGDVFVRRRSFELTKFGMENTRFTMTETFSGRLAPLFLRLLPSLQLQFDEFTRCLKAEVEGSAPVANAGLHRGGGNEHPEGLLSDG